MTRRTARKVHGRDALRRECRAIPSPARRNWRKYARIPIGRAAMQVAARRRAAIDLTSASTAEERASAAYNTLECEIRDPTFGRRFRRLSK